MTGLATLQTPMIYSTSQSCPLLSSVAVCAAKLQPLVCGCRQSATEMDLFPSVGLSRHLSR